MVFTKRLREGVRRGRIRCSIRIWKGLHVKVGGRYPMDEGHIVVDSVASIEMAELSLLPAARQAANDTLIVADGTSCRHQIKDGSGRDALHVARVLEISLADNRDRASIATH